MCSCGTPTVNGQPGYRWQPNDAPSVYAPNAPDIEKGEVILFDEAGRCAALDSHSHHFRVVSKNNGGYFFLLVRHGGGDERFRLPWPLSLIDALTEIDSNTRYWALASIYYALRDARKDARQQEGLRWRKAAAEKRIKVRKVRGQDAVTVSIID